MLCGTPRYVRPTSGARSRQSHPGRKRCSVRDAQGHQVAFAFSDHSNNAHLQQPLSLRGPNIETVIAILIHSRRYRRNAERSSGWRFALALCGFALNSLLLRFVLFGGSCPHLVA